MFKAFTFKTLASLAVVAALACVGAADPALAKKKKQDDSGVPGHWERSQDGGFEWVGKKPKKMPMGGDPVVRDHRNNGGGVVTGTSDPIVRDHRNNGGGVIVTGTSDPIVRDHRNNGGGVIVTGTSDPIVRD